MNPNEQPEPAKPGVFARLRRLPGSRTAAAAFVLTIALGVGGPAAYAWWSQQGSAAVNVTAGAPTPPAPTPAPTPPAPTPTPTPPGPTPGPTTPPGPPTVGPNPVLAGWPGKPTPKPKLREACVPIKDEAALKKETAAAISFNWLAPIKGTPPTGYVIRVSSNSPAFAFDQVQNVTATNAVFTFPRSPSDPASGNATAPSTPYYTTYTVRVIPMNGTVAGDPLYWTYEYEHSKLNNCYDDRGQGSGRGTVGNTSLTCPLPALAMVDGYPTLTLSWQPAPAAASYRVTVVSSGRGTVYGLDTIVSATQATLRLAKEPGAYGQYVVRVQPMNGSGAGDPAYMTYQLGQHSHECWKTGSESL